MADRKGLACRTCGRIFPVQPGADLHCDHQCKQDYQLAGSQATAALIQEGFSPDAAAPNQFWKDGVAVTLEQVIHEGFEEAMAAHAIAVAAHAG